MPMEFQPADYALGALTIVFAVLGLFRGFSGLIAFLAAAVAASATGAFAWPHSASFAEALWARGGLTFIACLLVFGLARLVVKKSVNGLLAQPTDSILGLVLGVLVGAMVITGWAYSGYCPEYSALVRFAAPYMR